LIQNPNDAYYIINNNDNNKISIHNKEEVLK
jgi:hypothetical protein